MEFDTLKKDSAVTKIEHFIIDSNIPEDEEIKAIVDKFTC